MKRSVFLIAILSCFGSALMAQNGEQTYRVHFATDVYTLPTEAFAELDKAILSSQNAHYYEIELNAHTDFIGSGTYNRKLSENRAQAVKTYLVSKGLDPDLISTGWYGEEKPTASNLSETGKQLNRRVEVVLKTYSFKSPSELLKTVGGDYRQYFKLNDGAQSITGKKGTKIDIPSDAFVLPDGSPVKNGETVFILEEFSSFADALYNNLSTQSNGKILESGGMMKLTAIYNGQELQLANGKTLEAQMPSNNLQPGMSVFVGNINNNGVVDWQQTQGDFEVQALNAPKAPYLQLDKEFLEKYLKPNPVMPEFPQHNLSLKVPIEPLLPSKPRDLSRPEMLDPDETFSRLFRIFTTKAYRQKLVTRRYAAAMKNFESRQMQYERRLKTYLAAIKNHKKEIQRYESELERFYAQIDSIQAVLRNDLDAHKEYNDVMRWNLAVGSLVKSSESDKLYELDPMGRLVRSSKNQYVKDITVKMYRLEDKYNFLQFVKTEDLDDIQRSYSIRGKISYEKYTNRIGNMQQWEREIAEYVRLNALQRENCLAEEFRYDPGLQNYFAKAVAKYEQEFEAAGMVNQQAINQVYSATIGKMGYINCDRFSDVPPERMAQLKIDNQDNAQIMVCIDRIRSVIHAYTDPASGVASVSLPQGERITVVAVRISEEGRPHFDKKETTVVKGDDKLKLVPAPVKLSYLKASLAAL